MRRGMRQPTGRGELCWGSNRHAVGNREGKGGGKDATLGGAGSAQFLSSTPARWGDGRSGDYRLGVGAD